METGKGLVSIQQLYAPLQRVYNYLRKTDHLDLLADLVGLYGIPVFATQDERKTLLKKAFKSKCVVACWYSYLPRKT